MGQTLYIDCLAGISGDMTVGMLLDLGADEARLRAAISSLHADGAEIVISYVDKKGVRACDFDVRLDEAHENHDHDMEYLHGHEIEKPQHSSDHEHHEHHDHHDHHKHHSHRTLSDVYEIIDSGRLTERAASTAKRIFAVLAEAEADAHGTTPEEVHFHEVGALDSIIDIVSVAVCMDDLDIADVIVPAVSEGEGTVRTQHGILDIPVPAVSYLLRAYDIKQNPLHIRGEHVTPTGASIVAALRTSDRLPESYGVIRTGTGAGKRDYDSAGILRGQLIELC